MEAFEDSSHSIKENLRLKTRPVHPCKHMCMHVLSVLPHWITVSWSVVFCNTGCRSPRRPQVCQWILFQRICGSHGLPGQDFKSLVFYSRYTVLCLDNSVKPVDNRVTILRANIIFSSTGGTGRPHTLFVYFLYAALPYKCSFSKGHSVCVFLQCMEWSMPAESFVFHWLWI